MKIAIFTDTFFPEVNGVANTLKHFTTYLTQQGIEYLVFAPESTESEFFSSHIKRFTSLPFFLYPECRLALPKISQVKEELLLFQPDIIHVATPFNIGLCGLHYAKKLQIPIVGSYHTDFDKYLQYYDLQIFNKLLWKYMHWFHRPLKKIYVPSLHTKEYLTKKGFINLDIWSRGVDHSLFSPNVDSAEMKRKYNIKEDFVLMYAGRLAPEKDVLLIRKINAQLPPSIRNRVRWVIVGDGPLKEELESTAPSNMTFTGFLKGKDLAELYALANLFVFPSPTETFGNVALESLASPVIAANAGGVRTIIDHGKTGYLCEEKNSQEFSNRIQQLLLNEQVLNNLSDNARKYAMTQSWDQIFEELLNSYEEIVRSDSLKHLA